MRKHRLKARLRACIAVSCAISMFAVSAPKVYADDVDQLEEETSALQSELSTLQNELTSLSTRINVLTDKINTTNETIKKTELDLAAARLNEEMQYTAMKKRIKFMYETGNPSFIEMVFASDSMSEFLNKTEFVKNITEYDKDILEELKEARKDIAKKEKALEKEREELQTLQAELTTERSSLNQAISSTSGKLKASSDALKSAKAAQSAANNALKTNTDTTAAPSKKEPSSGSSSGSGSSKPSSSTNDLVLLAALLQCEAGSSNYESLLAVATVVMNRVESSRYPNSIYGVIYQSGQFSPTWNGSLKRVLAKGPSSLAYQAAGDAMNGKRLGKVKNCYSFNATWATSKKGVTIGGNIFW